MKNSKLLIVLLVLFCGTVVFGQEKYENKVFNYYFCRNQFVVDGMLI